MSFSCSSHEKALPPPIPVFGVPRNVRPIPQIKIPLWWHALDGIGWKERGEVCTKTQLEDAILQSAGQHLPNGLLPALDPGDVLILAEGEFWITREWKIEPYCVPRIARSPTCEQ